MGGEGLRVSPNEGKDYGEYVIPSPPEPDELFQVPVRTGSVAVVAHPNNSGFIYLGWDEELDSQNGFILTAGMSISVDLDIRQQDLFITGDDGGDSVRYIATN